MPQDPPEPALTGTLIVGAIEGRYVRVEREDGTFEDWILASLPCGVEEGDIIRLHVEGRDLEMHIDHATTQARRTQAQAQMNVMNRDAPTGEIEL